MAYRKSQICATGVAATVALHAALGLTLLQSDGARSSMAAVPVVVSLIESAGQERVVALPKPLTEPRSTPRPPRAVPPTKAPPANDAPTLASSTRSSPRASMSEASVRVPVESPPVGDAPAPESSITLPSFDADYIDNPPPVYPALARHLGEQGRVLLRALVRADGTPAEVTIHQSSGYTRLDRAALDAVRRWRFVPARRGGTAIAASVLIPISFTLQE